jgi:hypothetical protein
MRFERSARSSMKPAGFGGRGPDRDVQGLVIAITTDEERGGAVAERQPNVRAVFLARCDAASCELAARENRRSAAEDQAAFPILLK